MSGPKVSVLLAVYNGGELLRPAVESILAQTWTDWELVAVDDGSSDQSAEILRSYSDPRVRLVTNEKNLGLTRSLNRGLEAARGQFVARQDADDLSEPTRLQEQVEFFQAHPEVQLLGTSCWRLNPEGKVIGSNDLATTDAAIRWASIVDNSFLHTSVMFGRERILNEFQGYDERYAICQDYDLWNRITAKYPVANLPGRLVRMREHPGSMTRTLSGATSDEGRQIAEPNRAIVFPGRVWTEREHQLLDLFRLRFAVGELAPLRALLTELLESFVSAHPEVATSADFHALLCRQALRLGYKFAREAPLVALGEIMRALRHSPREWLRQGLTMARSQF